MSVEHLFSASIGLAIFIAALILGKKNKNISDYILLFWLLVFTVNFISFFLLDTSKEQFKIWEILIFEFTESSIFLHGPIIFFYTLSLINVSFVFRPKQFLHLVPFFLAFTLLLVPVFQGNEYDTSYRNILLVGKMTSLLIYLTLVLKMLYSHKTNVEDIFSNTDKKYLTWLLVIGWGGVSIWIIATISLVLQRLAGFEIPQYGGVVTNVSMALLLYVMGYFGVRQPSLFVDHSKKAKSMDGKYPKTMKSKYERSGLSAKDAQQVHQKIVGHMLQEKPFLNPELTLYSLAEQLQLKPNHLSQIINSIEKKNFFDFINYYRIEEVKKNLQFKRKKHLTLLGLAYECGFNSKASFNRTFKKLVGETPSEYKKRLNSQKLDYV